MSDHPIRRRILFIALLLSLAIAAFISITALIGPGSVTAAEEAPKKGEDAKGGPHGAPKGPPPALIRVGEVSQQDLQPRVTIIGRFKELRRVTIGAGQQGRVIEMKIEEGDSVDDKTVLARIDQTFAKIDQLTSAAKLLEAKALETQAKANLEQATRDRVFYDELEKTNSAKPREVENARATEMALKAKHEQTLAAITGAEQAIEQVKEELKRFNIMASFDGVVVKKYMEHGQWVQKGAPVVEIISRGMVDAVVDVPERHINSLFKDEDIELLVDALNVTVTGKIQAIVPDGTTAARTFPVKIRLDDIKGKLKPGMSMTAWIPTGKTSPMLTVPRDAVLITSTGSVVWVVMDGKALKVDVDVLFGEKGMYAVQTSRRNAGPPLAVGQQIVIEGGERLAFPGYPVIISDRR